MIQVVSSNKKKEMFFGIRKKLVGCPLEFKGYNRAAYYFAIGDSSKYDMKGRLVKWGPGHTQLVYSDQM